LTDYEGLLQGGESKGKITVINDNFDTGTRTGPGEYPLADKTYADLLDRLDKNHFVRVSPKLRTDLLSYFRDPNVPFSMQKNKKRWAEITREIGDLQSVEVAKD
jgi:hypothetical protein